MINQSSIQLSHTLFENMQDKYILSVLAKRCYKMDVYGKLHHTPDAESFSNEMKLYKEGEELLQTDFDTYPYKPYTDIIIKGAAQNHTKQKQFQVRATVGDNKPFIIEVFGNRYAWKDNYGKIKFSEITIVEEIPLTYANAYGGADRFMEQQLPPVNEVLKKSMPGVNFDYSSIYRYPRNPCGKGYVIHNNKDSFENIPLPNLEYPNHLLTPENIVVGDPFLWPKQPLPRATDWVNHAWFPRIDYFGIIPVYEEGKYTEPLAEVIERLAEPYVYKNLPQEKKLHPRGNNGASLGLQFPYLKGNEIITLNHLIPGHPNFTIQLPGEAPVIHADGRKGKMIKTNPVIQTLVLDLQENHITVIWQGIAPAVRPYYDEELKTMPFEVKW